jgi:site-specific recombinase XerD
MTLDQLIQLYLRTGKLEGKTDMTLTWYTRRLGQFKRFLEARGHSMQVSQLKLEDGEAYIASLMEQDERWAGHPNQKGHKGQKLSLYTIHGHARVLRALTHWAYEENYLDEDPFERLPVTKVPKLEIEILTEEEINRIFESFNPATPHGKRLQTMMTLLLDTGIRAGEFLGLTVDNVNIEEGQIKVFGKGRKERSVPIGLTTQKELMTYIEFHRPQPARPDIRNVFLTKHGFPMTYSGLCSIVERLKNRTGIQRLHLHLFRHTAITMMIEREVPEFMVRQIAGHSSIKTTQIYVHLAQSRTNLHYQKNSVVDGLQILQRRSAKRAPSNSKQNVVSG